MAPLIHYTKQRMHSQRESAYPRKSSKGSELSHGTCMCPDRIMDDDTNP